jgi:hypothetical protein
MPRFNSRYNPKLTMNISIITRVHGLLRLAFFTILFILASPGAHAGLTIEVHIVRFEHGQAYKFFTPLYTNSTPPAAPLGAYFIYSPFYSTLQSTNGSWREIEVSTNGAVSVDGTENPYPDFNSVMQQMTNGIWTMVFTNNTTTNTYTFTVSAPNMTSNMLPATVISYPSDGALNIPNQPTFTWQGPGSWSVNNNTYVYNYDFSFFQYASLPSAQNNWTIPATIPNGINCTFYLDYVTNSAPLIFTTSTPLDSNSQPLQGWITTNVIETGDNVSFAVTNPPVATPTLVAHYTFDNSGNLGQDSSGNGYDLDFNGGDGVTSTNDARVGSGAAYFDGNSFFSYNSTPTNVLNTLAGDFSLAFWIKTTQNDGNENGDAFAGDGIVAADVPGTAYDLVPAALDGGEIGFNTGGIYGDDTINTTTDINDGNYHHVVITREEATGEKQIYIDGQLNNTDLATMNPLSDPRMVAIGCAIDASQTDPNSIYADPRQFFQGQLDDLQLYSGVLTSNQVAQLYTVAQAGTTLVAHYTFDNIGNLGQDSSGNGNDMSGESYWGQQHQFDADAEAGGGAVQFFGTDAMTPANSQVLTNLNAVLAGSFTFSAWVKTTITNGADYNNAFFGAVIFWAYNDRQGDTNDTIPLSITGSKAAFTTRGGNPGLSDNLHSITSVNDGNYHLITVTRDQSTGEKTIYVDGNFENSQLGTTNPLNGNNYNITIGGWNYILDSNSTLTNYSSYNGLLDDLQIYSGVLSGSDVAYLYQNPGSSVPNIAAQDFNPALNTTGLPWATSGDTSWFIETTNTSDGVSAAQSGIVTNNQSSTLSVTVTGPGTLTFSWACMADNTGFDYEVYTNGDPNGGYLDDLYYNTSGWYQDGPFRIAPGTQTISWTVFANFDTDPTEAGFLDQVNYIPDTAPTITLNPFSQTNYPGYPVWLSANATSNPAATWQWYEVGTGAISGATSSYFIPTNSGTAGVAGSYYAIASNDVGSAITTTATVSFVSAPLPPDWARAFKTQLANNSTDATTNYNIACLLDSTGTNIYTVGSVDGTNTFGSDVLISRNGGFDSSFLKQTTTGTPVWGRSMTNNGHGSSFAQCMAVAPGDGFYVAGDFSGTNWLGTNLLVDTAGGSTYLARFDANGNNLWVRTIIGTNSNFTSYHMLAADPAGNVTLSALVSGGTSFGTTNLFVQGQQGVLVQYDANGNVRWLQVPSSWPNYLTYSGGRIYGGMGGSAANYIGGVTNASNRTLALFSINATNGQGFWVQGIAAQQGQNSATGFGDDNVLVAVSGTNVFVAGSTYGSNAVFGSFTVPLPPEARSQYFARFDTNGNAQLATSFGSQFTWPWAITASASGVYIGGDFDTYSIFGKDIIAAPFYNTVQFVGTIDSRIPGQAFVAKFDRNGNPLWARLAQSQSSYLNSRDIAIASDGVWSCGFFDQIASFGSNTVYGAITVIGFPIGIIQYHSSGYLAKVTDVVAQALPVVLLNPQDNGANFQLSFLSQSGFMHAVQYRTDLISGNWQTYSNVIGDGTLKTIPIPLSVFGSSPQGFIRVSTQ